MKPYNAHNDQIERLKREQLLIGIVIGVSGVVAWLAVIQLLGL